MRKKNIFHFLFSILAFCAAAASEAQSNPDLKIKGKAAGVSFELELEVKTSSDPEVAAVTVLDWSADFSRRIWDKFSAIDDFHSSSSELLSPQFFPKKVWVREPLSSSLSSYMTVQELSVDSLKRQAVDPARIEIGVKPGSLLAQKFSKIEITLTFPVSVKMISPSGRGISAKANAVQIQNCGQFLSHL